MMQNEKTDSQKRSLHDEVLVDLSTARRTLIPCKKNGKAISPSTMWRWIRRGINDVRLEVRYVGSVPHTSQEAIQRFFDGVTEKRLAAHRSSDSGTVTVTEADLKKAGLL